jgi:hypothetical protein
LVALNDLREMESDRRAEESARAAEQARLAAERQAAEERRRAEEASRLRALEREAEHATVERSRLAGERNQLAAALGVAAERSDALAAELASLRASIQRDRNVASAPGTAAADPSPPPVSRRTSRLALAGAIAGLAVGLAVVALRPPRERVVVVSAPAVTAPAPPVAASPPVAVAVPRAEPPAPAPRPRRKPRPTTPSTSAEDIAAKIAACGDDPTCGLKL